jgi:hypothetical protein
MGSELMESGFADCCMKQQTFGGCETLKPVRHEQQLLRASFIIQAAELRDIHRCSSSGLQLRRLLYIRLKLVLIV